MTGGDDYLRRCWEARLNHAVATSDLLMAAWWMTGIRDDDALEQTRLAVVAQLDEGEQRGYTDEYMTDVIVRGRQSCHHVDG